MQALTQYGDLEREMEQEPATPAHQANAMTNGYRTDPAILKTLEKLTEQMALLSTTMGQQNGNGNGTANSGGNHNLPSVNPRTGRPYKRYCWTHGCCNHWSRHCNNKKPGHKNEATFKNRMNGSNENCLPNPDKKE